MLKLADMSNLTIYSKNGAKITHTCIDITGSNNIIIKILNLMRYGSGTILQKVLMIVMTGII